VALAASRIYLKKISSFRDFFGQCIHLLRILYTGTLLSFRWMNLNGGTTKKFPQWPHLYIDAEQCTVSSSFIKYFIIGLSLFFLWNTPPISCLPSGGRYYFPDLINDSSTSEEKTSDFCVRSKHCFGYNSEQRTVSPMNCKPNGCSTDSSILSQVKGQPLPSFLPCPTNICS
jgi:hypothetical protein